MAELQHLLLGAGAGQRMAMISDRSCLVFGGRDEEEDMVQDTWLLDCLRTAGDTEGLASLEVSAGAAAASVSRTAGSLAPQRQRLQGVDSRDTDPAPHFALRLPRRRVRPRESRKARRWAATRRTSRPPRASSRGRAAGVCRRAARLAARRCGQLRLLICLCSFQALQQRKHEHALLVQSAEEEEDSDSEAVSLTQLPFGGRQQ
eukprot:COSAG04_NODE_2211_length_4523_cov_5.122061_5_plen_204_part_00